MYKWIRLPIFLVLLSLKLCCVDEFSSHICFNLVLGYAAAVQEQSSNGYLLIAASGGLNQQRTGVSEIMCQE